VVTVRTRAEPKPAAGGRVFHVYPHDFKGAKTEPSFEGLMCAYNFWCAGTDWATSGRPRVQAGDTILVHCRHLQVQPLRVHEHRVGESHRAARRHLLPDREGHRRRSRSSIKAAGDGEVIFDGNGNFAVFDVRAADYTYFEGVTIRNAEYGILAGTQFIAGAKGLTVKRSRFENVGSGVFTNFAGSSNFYIADNTFIGRNDPKHLIGWNGDALWSKFNGVDGQIYPPKMASYVAVKLYGPGHVVAYNSITDFHDGINVETYGNPDGSVANGPGHPRRPALSAARVLRPPPGGDRLLQQLHLELARQPDRSRRRHAQHPRDAEHVHQPRVARLLQPAGARRPRLLDPQHRLQPAGRLDAAHQRLVGRVFYNNTILSETQAQLASNVHWRNNLMLGRTRRRRSSTSRR
jgi:hypothetical protein